MPPNVIDITPMENVHTSKVNVVDNTVSIDEGKPLTSALKSINILVHLLIGLVVGVTVIFSLRLNAGATKQHILMCTIGYQLLMAQSILSLSPHNSWTAHLSLQTKRRVHWILQLGGAALVIGGSILMSLSKSVNWNTLHGKFGLVALVFTTVSLVNGLTSLYAYELRKILPGIISKLTHICFGTVAFTTACVSLAYGFDKNSFKGWTSPEVAQGMVALTGILNIMVIVSPLLVFSDKFVGAIRSKFS